MPDARPPRNHAVRPLGWTAGVDWYRKRIPWGEHALTVRRAAEELQAWDAAAGEKVKDWSFQGAEGRASPRVRWGTTKDTLWWETSGAWAADTLTRMPLSGGRCTRLDLQSTWLLSKPVPEFGTRFLPHEGTTPCLRLPNGKPIGISRLPDGGWLGTVGRRTSPEYFRLYDKGVETRERRPGWSWRMELEVKYDHAKALEDECRQGLTNPTWCAQYVISRWRQSGLLLPLNVGDGSYDAVRPEPRPEPSCEKMLGWLDHSVRPVVERLLAAGKRAEVLFALGLSREAEREAPDGDAR